MKRLLLALVPVVLLASVALAYPGLTTQLSPTAAPVALTGSGGSGPARPAPVMLAQAPYTPPPTTTQPQPQSQQPAPPPPAAPAPAVTEESVPLVVDKSQLVEAAALLERAIQQAKLAVDAADARAQQMYIQETINLLAGSANVHFKPAGQAAETAYTGVAPLLSQALAAREAAEQKWLAALEQRDSQIYVAGPGGTIPPAATSSMKLSTQGLRPEEQATLLVNRAILQATNALRIAAEPAEAASDSDDKGTVVSGASTDAADLMAFVVRQLEAAQKIVQIALNR